MQRENGTRGSLMIKTILSPVTGTISDTGGLTAAFLVAKAFQAHVDTLYIRPLIREIFGATAFSVFACAASWILNYHQYRMLG
jgi:predicted phosphoribosyltransferase